MFVQLSAFTRKVAVFGWTEGFPEELVIQVATSIKVDLLLKRDHGLHIPLVQRLQLLFKRRIKVVHVIPVVLTVVEVEELATDDWFKCAELVGQLF